MAEQTDNQMTVMVLGAGATRACSFADSRNTPCLPPLDTDFFTQLQRVPDEKHQAHIDDVVKDVVTLFGNNFEVTLETVFATLEHTIRMLRTTGTQRAYKRADLEAMRDRLLGAIAIAMEASLAERSKDGHVKQAAKACRHHQEIVKQVLQRKDHIVSFNYDCVIDYALQAVGDDKWHPRYGYGFDLGARGVNLSGDSAWAPGTLGTRETTIHLHKLHGSLHFRFESTESKRVDLKQRPYTKQRGTPRYSIIPPESNKAYDRGIFAQLWKNAAEALGKAKNLVFIGYSLPETDLHANALFRTSLREGGLNSLVIVNPDREARGRTRAVVQRGLSQTTRVLSFDSLPLFLATDVAVWKRK
jgi:uncharacterized protein (DUF2267 family)